MKDKTKIILLSAAGVGVLGLCAATHFAVANWVTTDHRLQVQQACDQSRAMHNSKPDYCGELQGKYHIEFLCNSTRADAYCWTELNDQINN